MRKENKIIKKMMCHNLEYLSECKYEECLMKDRGIPKEECKDFKEDIVEEEYYKIWNQCLDEVREVVG
jgi:hypothetical protein